MKGSPKSSLRPFLHQALQLYVFFLFFAISYTANRKKCKTHNHKLCLPFEVVLSESLRGILSNIMKDILFRGL